MAEPGKIPTIQIATPGGQLIFEDSPVSLPVAEELAKRWDLAVRQGNTVVLTPGVRYVPDGTCPHCKGKVRQASHPDSPTDG